MHVVSKILLLKSQKSKALIMSDIYISLISYLNPFVLFAFKYTETTALL